MNSQPDFMRVKRQTGPPVLEQWSRRAKFLGGLAVVAGGVGCGGNTLDLGHSAPPSYATPETIAAGDNAPTGVPTPIATHQFGAYAIAVDDERVYWSTLAERADTPAGCVVKSCLKNDCAASLVTYPSPECVGPGNRLLVTRSRVLWLSNSDPASNYIFACPIEGCPEKVATRWVRGSALTFAVDDTHLYWQSADAMIWRCPLDRCPEERTLVARRDSVPSYSTRDTAPAVDDTDIYWFETEGEISVIKTAPKDGSALPRTFAFDIGDASDLRADNSNVYWLKPRGKDVAVLRCPRTDCSGGPVVLTALEEIPSSSPMSVFQTLALSEGQFLWSTNSMQPTFEQGTSNVRACSLDGCGATPTLVVQDQKSLTGIAVDRTHVYWTSSTPLADEQTDYRDTIVQRIRRRP